MIILQSHLGVRTLNAIESRLKEKKESQHHFIANH
jgi:hypothetical protein